MPVYTHGGIGYRQVIQRDRAVGYATDQHLTYPLFCLLRFPTPSQHLCTASFIRLFHITLHFLCHPQSLRFLST